MSASNEHITHHRNRPAGWLLAFTALVAAPVAAPADVAPRVGYSHLLDRPLVLGSYGDRFLSRADFNGDGLDDVLIGGDHTRSLEKTPLYLLVSSGDGTFRDSTADIVLGEPRAAAPVGVTADFNADGRPDVAVFDAGNLERGQDPAGGYYGEAPILLLSTPAGKLALSDALARAVLEAERARFPNPGPELHVKHASAGDIDNDGDVDMFVESGGGFENLSPHFMINNGDGSFTVDGSNERISRHILVGDTFRWRYDANELADMDGDGAIDLVLGQLRRINNQQEGLTSRILFNDGYGRFPEQNVVDLPLPHFRNGWTFARSLLTADVNADGRRDVLIAHTRATDDSLPNERTWTGRYIQVLISQGNRRFADESDIRMGDQSATTATASPVYGWNTNVLHGLRYADANGDGSRDLIMGLSLSPVGPQAPLVHLNDGAGVFWAMDPAIFTGGAIWFGEMAFPIDLNGDGLLDFVHSDLLPGRDGVYNTGDEHSRLISSLAVGPPPVCSFQIAPSRQTVSAEGGTRTVAMTTTPACAWTATSNANWITITSNPSSTGTGDVSFTVAPRTSAAARSGTVTIADRTLVVIQQGSRAEDLAMDFGPTYGIWIHGGTGWRQLHASSPELMVALDADGNGLDDLAIDFGPGVGLWMWANHRAWTPLHSRSPAAMVVGDFDGDGDDELVVDFPGNGLWALSGGSGTWTSLHGFNSRHLATANLDGAGGQELIVDFPGYGLWAYADGSWSLLHPFETTSMAVADLDGDSSDDLVVDFPAYGIWRYRHATGWSSVHPLDASRLAAGDLDGNGKSDLVIDFGATFGLWILRNGTTWAPLHNLPSEELLLADMDGNGHDEVIVDFGPAGVWSHEDGSGWQLIHVLSPEAIVGGRLH